MKYSSNVLALLVISFILPVALGGCSNKPEYQASLIESIEGGDAGFMLPRGADSNAPISLWDQILIVCPYSDTSTVPEPFMKKVSEIDVNSTDSIQWLFFSGENNVERVSIDRNLVDFCGSLDGVPDYGSDQIWSASKSGDAWILKPSQD